MSKSSITSANMKSGQLLANYLQNVKDGARNPSIGQATKAQQHEAQAQKQGGSTTSTGGPVIGMAAVSVASGPGKVSAGGNPGGKAGPVEYRPIYGSAPAPATAPAAQSPTTAAPAPPPAPYSPPASVTEARERAQEVVYRPDRQPKLFEDGTPKPYDSVGQVSKAANAQGAYNAEYSIGQKNIGDMVAENFDKQLANFGSGLPSAPKPDEAMAGALSVVQRYKSLFG